MMDLRDYTGVLRRHILLIAAITLACLGVTLAYSFTRTPIYTATTEVLVQPDTLVLNPTLRPDQTVSLDTEARVVKSALIASIAQQKLHSDLSIPALLENVSVQVTPDTLVLDIVYSARSAAESARGANAFADSYIQYKRGVAQDIVSEATNSIEDEITQLQSQERDANRVLESAVPGSLEYRNAQSALDRIGAQQTVLASQLVNLPSVLSPGQVIIPALPPTAPSSPRHPLNAAMGLFIGLFLGIVVAFLKDRLDDRIRSLSEIEECIAAPALAVIPHVSARRRRGPTSPLVILEDPRSQAAEAYRTLRTSVMAMSRQREVKVLAIVSPSLGEGKSTTAANLSTVLSQADKRVVVVSADLRRPSIHGYFGIENKIGLTEVLLGEATIEDALHRPGLDMPWIIPGGQNPMRPVELLQGPEMLRVVERLRHQFDFVVLDCPPVLGLADSLAVAPLADAVLIVAKAGTTARGALRHAREQLIHVGVTIAGGILNAAGGSTGGVYQQYGYSPSGEYLRAPVLHRAAGREAEPGATEDDSLEDSGNGNGGNSVRGDEASDWPAETQQRL